MKGFYIKAFGCKLNQYEAEYVRERLETHLEYTENSPDIVVVYGCTVTSRADAKVRRFIRRARRIFPRARIVLLGCSSRTGESFGADELFPDTNIFLASLGINGKDWFDTSGFFGHTRSFVKVQDGCERFCSYCIVPFTRGAERSRPPNEVIEQIKRLTELGFKEVVLTGVRIGGYSSNGYNLVCLLEQLLDKSDIPRIRLSSIDPDEITDELIDIIAGNSRIMPHLHIPLQSGSNRILSLMRREYTREQFLNTISSITGRFPDLGLGTDVIVGFPSETERDFEDTYNLIEALPFTYLHIFRFSERKGTVASTLPDRVPEGIKSKRAKALSELAIRKRLEAARKRIAIPQEVLFERKRDSLWEGHSKNYIICKTRSEENIRGKIIGVIPEETTSSGELICREKLCTG